MTALEFQTVSTDIGDGVAWVTLNRPEALNAWTPRLGQELAATLELLEPEPSVRAIVLTGAGRAFSSGADLKSAGLLGEGGKPDVRTPLREVYHPLILRVRALATPVVAAVNGPAVGIGCSLALASDLIVAAESAYFLMAFANVALGLDGGASATLIARVGVTRASEIALLADRITATQALDWGLINRVVPDGELGSAAAEFASRLAAGSSGANATIKKTLNDAAYTRLGELLELEAELQQLRAESPDFVEAVKAFAEKRRPRFSAGPPVGEPSAQDGKAQA
jgi:2-(1,2-epoxy-1,2-dihydrophenyl)acetyl-CoA isomerase